MVSTDILRKRLYYQSWHRGTREADLLLGGFADAYLADFDEEELREFETLLACTDVDIFDWLQSASLPSYPFNMRLAQQFKVWTREKKHPIQSRIINS